MLLNGVSYTYKKRIGMIFMVMQDVNHQLFTESVLDEVLISQPEENKEEAKERGREREAVVGPAH